MLNPEQAFKNQESSTFPSHCAGGIFVVGLTAGAAQLANAQDAGGKTTWVRARGFYTPGSYVVRDLQLRP